MHNMKIAFLQLKHLKTDTIRIGVLSEAFGLSRSDPKVDQLIRSTVDEFASATGACVEEVSIPLTCYGNHDSTVQYFQHCHTVFFFTEAC